MSNFKTLYEKEIKNRMVINTHQKSEGFQVV